MLLAEMLLDQETIPSPDLDVSVADRMAAGRELMKRLEKAEGQKEETGGITIINNIPRPEEIDGDS